MPRVGVADGLVGNRDVQDVFDDETARPLGDEVFHGFSDEVWVVLRIEEGAEDDLVWAEVDALILVLEAGHEFIIEDTARETPSRPAIRRTDPSYSREKSEMVYSINITL